MNIEKLQQLNTTLLFSEPLNPNLINLRELSELFKSGGDEKNKHSFIEAPGVKVLNLHNKQVELVFEQNRLLVNEGGIESFEKSELLNYFSKITGQPFVDKTKIVAYGFNYFVTATNSGSVDFSSFVSDSIKNIVNETIEGAGVKIDFKKDGNTYGLDITPTGIKTQVLVHLNTHYPSTQLPSDADLKNAMQKGYKELTDIIAKI